MSDASIDAIMAQYSQEDKKSGEGTDLASMFRHADSELAELRAEADKGNMGALFSYTERGITIFRYVMIAVAVTMLFASLCGLVSGGYLLAAADNGEMSDSWKNSARTMGAIDVSTMFLLIVASILFIVTMTVFEKQVKVAIFKLVRGSPAFVKTIQQYHQEKETPVLAAYKPVTPTKYASPAAATSAPAAAPAAAVAGDDNVFQF